MTRRWRGRPYRPPLTERRKAETRPEIAREAVRLFAAGIEAVAGVLRAGRPAPNRRCARCGRGRTTAPSRRSPRCGRPWSTTHYAWHTAPEARPEGDEAGLVDAAREALPIAAGDVSPLPS